MNDETLGHVFERRERRLKAAKKVVQKMRAKTHQAIQTVKDREKSVQELLSRFERGSRR